MVCPRNDLRLLACGRTGRRTAIPARTVETPRTSSVNLFKRHTTSSPEPTPAAFGLRNGAAPSGAAPLSFCPEALGRRRGHWPEPARSAFICVHACRASSTEPSSSMVVMSPGSRSRMTAHSGTTGETRCPCQALRLQVVAARAIDDETHRARRVGGLGPLDQPRGGSRRRA